MTSDKSVAYGLQCLLISTHSDFFTTIYSLSKEVLFCMKIINAMWPHMKQGYCYHPEVDALTLVPLSK